ncbi:MAG: hypothetical protein EOM54_06005 [Clostridia bacterium]|nr:hypothetical protein [Clostridia bacterium]
MTAKDREAALAKYIEMFNAAESEEDLLSKLGSPTRVAICELRGYIPSAEPEANDESPAAAIPGTQAAEAPAAQAAPEGLIEPEPVPEAITETPEPSSGSETAAEAPPNEAPSREKVPDNAGEDELTPVSGPEGSETFGDQAVLFDFSEQEEAPAPAKTAKPRVIGGRLALYILFGIVACIPATAVLIALCLFVLALGGVLISAGIFVISLGFVGITVFADIMLLFGAGLILAAFGIPIAFFSFWLFLRVVVGFVNLILRTGGNWCCGLDKEARK